MSCPTCRLATLSSGAPTPCVCRQHERSSRRLRSLQSIGNLEALQRLTFANFIAGAIHAARRKRR
jgi:hypothetical protein